MDRENGSLTIRDRIKGFRRVKASELTDHPSNWRIHPAPQKAALRDLLKEIGIADALIVRETSKGLMLIDGHLRKSLDPNIEWPVLILDVDQAEADKMLLTLDPLAAMAETDSERALALLRAVETDSDAVNALLERTFGAGDWQPGYGEPAVDPGAHPDRAAELQAKWGTAPGQAWEIGPHRLVCGDCRDEGTVGRLWRDGRLKVRLVWTDPPYGVNLASKNARLNRTDRGGRVQRPIVGDDMGPEEVGALFCAALLATVNRTEPGAPAS